MTLTDDSTGAGGSWTTNSPGYYFDSNGYRTIDFETDNLGNLAEVTDKYQYGFISYCSYDTVYQTYRQNGNYSEEMQMFDTYVKSTIYNSSIPCTIKYITWKFKFNCGASGTNCFAVPRFKFYGDVSDYSLRSYGFTKEPLQIDTSSGQILNQNATIITQNDTIINTDISDNDKHLPSKGSFEDFKSAEKNLTDKVKEADTSVLSIGIDSTSSSWVWDTLTSLIKSNTIIFGMFIAILSIGVIKLGLGR